LGYLARKIVSEMTYNVSSGTLNTTIPYHTPREDLACTMRGISQQKWDAYYAIFFRELLYTMANRNDNPNPNCNRISGLCL